MAAALVMLAAAVCAAAQVHAGSQPESMQAMFDGLKSQITSALVTALSTELTGSPPPATHTRRVGVRGHAQLAPQGVCIGGPDTRPS